MTLEELENIETMLLALPSYQDFEGPYNEVDDALWKLVGDSHRYTITDSIDRTLRFMEKHSPGFFVWRMSNMEFGVYGGHANVSLSSGPFLSFTDLHGNTKSDPDVKRFALQIALLIAWVRALKQQWEQRT